MLICFAGHPESTIQLTTTLFGSQNFGSSSLRRIFRTNGRSMEPLSCGERLARCLARYQDDEDHFVDKMIRVSRRCSRLALAWKPTSYHNKAVLIKTNDYQDHFRKLAKFIVPIWKAFLAGLPRRRPLEAAREAFLLNDLWPNFWALVD